ncbi:MAG: alpha/beta hydrolase [Actinomycetota bacterium]
MLVRRAAALLAATAALVACASPASTASSSTTGPRAAPDTSQATTTVPATTTTTLVLPPAVPIQWRGCGGPFDCATVAAPVDYSDPGGPTLELAVVRRRAGDPGRRIGSLLVNPGGPGASGVDRVLRGFTISPEVADRFDIVGFDPRGIGDSSPIQCGASVGAFRSLDLAPDSAQEAQALATAAEAVAAECARTEGERLAHLGTSEVARDVEVIRRAIGEPQISFVGLSYGTLIGLLWADEFPGSVRALVLDGVVDPASDGEASAMEQLEGIDRTFASMDSRCAQDPACQLTSSGGLAASYDELARRLEAGEAGGAGVGPTQLAYAAFSATYGPSRWPELWRAVRRGLDGDLGGVAEMSSWFTRLVPYAPFAIVSCLDAPHPVGFDAWQADTADVARASPRFGRVAANELLPCAFMPLTDHEPHEVSLRGAPLTLVIGSTGDAATPYDQAVRVSQALESASLLTVEMEGHIAIDDSACTDAVVTRYLVDLVGPAPGVRC